MQFGSKSVDELLRVEPYNYTIVGYRPYNNRKLRILVSSSKKTFGHRKCVVTPSLPALQFMTFYDPTHAYTVRVGVTGTHRGHRSNSLWSYVFPKHGGYSYSTHAGGKVAHISKKFTLCIARGLLLITTYRGTD